jgi:hypothetical protein
MAKKLNTYEIKYTQNKKVSKKYVDGAKERDEVLRMMRNNNSYSKVSSKIYKKR